MGWLSQAACTTPDLKGFSSLGGEEERGPRSLRPIAPITGPERHARLRHREQVPSTKGGPGR